MQESKGAAAKPSILGIDGKPADSPSPKCGNCYFWHIDLAEGASRGFCFGEPPRMFMVNPPKQVGTQVQYSMEMMRPKMHKNEPPCRFWRPKNWDMASAVIIGDHG